nr:hypothetical protein [Tanacetum cinerariifolium]
MELCTSLQRQQSQMAAEIKDQDFEISSLKARVKFLEDKDRGSAEPTQEDAPITKGIKEIEEEVRADKSIELGSNDTEEMVNVLSSMDAANILTSEVTAASVSPVAGVLAAGVPTVIGSFPTVSAIFTTASVVTPYTKRPRGITIRAREMEEEFARENQRVSEQLARDSEIARLHAEEKLKIMIEEGKRVQRQGLKIDQGSSKRMKTYEDVSEEDLKGMMQLVSLEEVYVEALDLLGILHIQSRQRRLVKHPIIDWEIHSKGKREYWKIIRLGGHTAVYQFFVDMLKQFDREDLYQLWTLVKETFSIRPATKDKEKELWDFQDSLDDEEDLRSSQVYMNDLEEEYQARSLLAKSKSSSASAPSSSSCKIKGLIVETYDWDQEELSSEDNEVTKVKAMMALTDSSCNEDNDNRKSFLNYMCIDLNYVGEQRNNLMLKHRNLVQELNTCKEQVFVLKQAKLDLLTMQHVNTKIRKENQNLKNELKELTSIIEAWLNSSNKVNLCINERIPTQKKKIPRIEQLTEDTFSFVPKDLIFVKSLADNVSITNSNKPRPKTIKSILMSKSTFKAKTLKGIIINEPSLAPSRGNKSSSASKTYSALAGSDLNGKAIMRLDVEPWSSVSKMFSDLNCGGFNMDRKITSAKAEDVVAAGCCANILWIKIQLTDYDIIYEKIKNHTLKRDTEFHFIPTQYQLADIFIKLLEKPSFKRLIDELGSPNMYKEYLAECWYSAKALKNSKEDIVIKLNKRHREKVVPYTRFLSRLMMHKMKEGYGDASLIVYFEPASGCDASADSTTEVDPRLSASNDSIPQQQGKWTSSIARQVEEEESSRTINLEDIAKLSQKHKLKLENNKAEVEAALLKAQPSFPNVDNSMSFCLTSQVTELKTLHWELPEEFLSLPIQVASIQAKLKTVDSLPSLLLNVTKSLNKFAQVLDSVSSKAGDQSVPSIGQANTMHAEGE